MIVGAVDEDLQIYFGMFEDHCEGDGFSQELSMLRKNSFILKQEAFEKTFLVPHNCFNLEMKR